MTSKYIEYNREWKRKWRLRQGMKPYDTPEIRFWAKVNKTDSCWLWTAHTNTKGYGMFHIDSKQSETVSHRFSYELLKGKIPDGMVLDHLCRVRSCVNPDHLEIVTWKENALRGYGPSAINARKQNCPKCGNNFSQTKTGRKCIFCLKKYKANWYLEKKKKITS